MEATGNRGLIHKYAGLRIALRRLQQEARACEAMLADDCKHGRLDQGDLVLLASMVGQEKLRRMGGDNLKPLFEGVRKAEQIGHAVAWQLQDRMWE